ncbi:MAG: hypothetical protein IPK16_26100 [Anaerolineales bacterium]|nr:hypothetical protein [Anaerolineales bacterium]
MRGDGVTVGPGTKNAWTPVLMDGQGWIENYRGLWGIDTEDPFGGERAPAGPKYNRDGSVRLAWYDPLAWAGLDKVPPPLQAVEMLQQRIRALSEERAELGEAFVKRRQEVRNLDLDVQALLQTDYLGHLSKHRVQELTKEQKELQGMSARLVALDETNAANAQLPHQACRSGDWGNPQAHLKHQHLPETVKTANSRAMDF